ncbi:hypothetical protein CsSME_00009923 [Camellia sinensis var. sinensis]
MGSVVVGHPSLKNLTSLSRPNPSITSPSLTRHVPISKSLN